MNFNSLSDNTVNGIFFKDEGSFLIVKFERATGQPAGNAMYEFGQLVSLSLTRKEVKDSENIEQLRVLLDQKFREQTAAPDAEIDDNGNCIYCGEKCFDGEGCDEYNAGGFND